MSKLSPLLVILLTVLPFSSSAQIGGSQSILREVKSNGGDRPYYGIELNATDFDSVLRETPASYAIVEFFANWCPACRNYKPHYEKVASLFNGPEAVHPGILLMTRIDCALKINNELCDKFSVRYYPMLLWGSPSKFVGRIWKPSPDESDICPINDGRTADRLLNWINKKMGSSYIFGNQKFDSI